MVQFEQLCKREVPLFPEVSAELKKLRATLGNEEYIVNRYRNREESNLGMQFTRIAQRAGIGKIVRPFDNMRASRSTEIYKEFGPKAENRWIGHSDAVALKHYLIVPDETFALAAGKKIIKSVDNTELGHPSEVTSE